MTKGPLTLQECKKACQEYNSKINYLEVLQSVVLHEGEKSKNGKNKNISGRSKK